MELEFPGTLTRVPGYAYLNYQLSDSDLQERLVVRLPSPPRSPKADGQGPFSCSAALTD